jgi:hypothetical protein
MEDAYDNDTYDDDCYEEIADRIMCGASDDSATTTGTGSTVRVYQPMPYKTSFSKHHPRMMDHQNHNRDDDNSTLTSTFIGGSRGRTDHTGSCDGFMCAICQDRLYPLVQYYNSVRGYTLQVRACNRPSCYRTLFPSVLDDDDDEFTATSNTRNGLHYGGNGVVVARRILLHNDNTNHPETTTGITGTFGTVSSTTSNTITASTTSTTPFEEAPSDSVVQVLSRNEWTSTMDMVEDGIERNVTTNSIKNQSCNENKDHDDHLDHLDDFDALESQLAAIEARNATTPSSSATTSVKKKNTMNKTKSTGNTITSPIDGFPCYMLHGLREPPAIQLHHDASIQDKDDVGLSGSTTSKNDQRKIQQMLQQYMEEMEDDTDMLHLLQQQQQQISFSSSNKYNGKSSNHHHHHTKNPMERDERLSVMDRALFTYMDRLKRIPRQVLRHGIGTLPLWSMYVKKSTHSTTPNPLFLQQSGSHLSYTLIDLFLFLYLDQSFHSNSNNRNCQVTNIAREIASHHRHRHHHRLWHRRKGINRRKFTAMNNHYRLVLFVVLGYGSNYKYYHQYCMC